jgi:Predicted hydrolases or acyltransferases (alpha/beta hydrolase superfamily)
MSKSGRFSVTYRGHQISISTRTRITQPDLVLFLHGLGCAKESFDFAFDDELLKEYSICTFDFPGHGQSDSLPAAHVSLEAFADITCEVIRMIAPRRVFLVCHSMGGAVGLIAAQSLPELAGFVSVEGNLIGRDCGLVSRATASQLPDDFAKDGFHWLADELTSSPHADLRAWGRWYSACEPYGLHATARSLVEWSDRGALPGMFRRIPARAYIHGQNSQLPHLTSFLAGETSWAVPDSGHFPMLDNPSEFYPLIAGFIADGGTGQALTDSGRARPLARVAP